MNDRIPPLRPDQIIVFALVLLAFFIGGCSVGEGLGQRFNPPVPAPNSEASSEAHSRPAEQLPAAPAPPPAASAPDGPTTARPAAPTPTAQAWGEQVSLLVLGVNSLEQSPGPTLEAVWLVMYRPPARRVFVLGLSPASLASPEGQSPMRLQDAFELDGYRTPEGGLFWRSLQSLAPVSPMATITLDREGFRQLVNLAGGAELEGRHHSPAETLTWLETRSAAGPIEALAAQTEALKGMVVSASATTPYPNPAALAVLVPEHALLSQSLDLMLTLAAPVLPLSTDQVYIQGVGGALQLAVLPDGEVAVIVNQ